MPTPPEPRLDTGSRMDRRAFLMSAAGLAAAAALAPGRLFADDPADAADDPSQDPSYEPGAEDAEEKPPGGEADSPPAFVPGHLRYAGGRWQEYPTAMASLLSEVRRRTSIDAGREAAVVDLSSPEIFEHPFLYLSGRYEFDLPGEAGIARLRRHLTYGGFLLIDDGLGADEEGFGRSARALVGRVFPRKGLEPLSREHAVHRSYYLLKTIGGRQAVSQELLGVQVGIFTPVIFCRNDLGGAWARRPDGGWVAECTPGGEPQRRAAFHLGVNIVLYAMTGNYKQDLIHHPFIQRRLNQG